MGIECEVWSVNIIVKMRHLPENIIQIIASECLTETDESVDSVSSSVLSSSTQDLRHKINEMLNS